MDRPRPVQIDNNARDAPVELFGAVEGGAMVISLVALVCRRRYEPAPALARQVGGRFLQEEFQGEMMGKKFNGLGLMGYDKFNKKYVNTWVDDMGTGIFVSEGLPDADGKVITHTGKMDEPMTGEKAKPVKMITRILSPDKNVFEMHDLSLGEKSKVMEITYTRKQAIEDGVLAAQLVAQLMEDENAEARRTFLAEHARKIKELDV